MTQTRLIGGPKHGRMVPVTATLDVVRINIPRMESSGLILDKYTRREWDGQVHWVSEDVSDAVGKILAATKVMA